MNNTLRIFWFIISQSCTKLPSTVENFDVIYQYGNTIVQFGQVYTSYVHHVGPSPERIFDVESSADVKVYFDWIQKLQDSFQSLRRQFSEGDYTYKDTIAFNRVSKLLKQISDMIFANPLVFEISDMKSIFIESLQKIENHLVLYNESNNECVMLHHLLEHYHVTIPQILTNNLTLLSTSEYRALEKDRNGRPLNVCILPKDDLTLRQLKELKKEVDEFVKPISECLTTAVFFLGHPCHSFEHYYDLFQRKETQLSKPNDEMTVDVFKRVLELTTKAMINLCGGKVQYSELPLEKEASISDVEFDFLLLFAKLHQCSSEGLSGIRSMAVISHLPLQLQTMKRVFEQYGLKHCHDSNFLKAIDESERMQLEKLTIKALDTVKMLKHIESLLHCSLSQLQDIIRLFESVADSAPFYQFVMDRKFYGPKGKELFQQKYELLTAQLQHEEYDDAVLNHLYAAYRVIILFLDTDQDYETFMSNVQQLDVTNGLKQLQTVNENITLIQLWFSRVEVINNTFVTSACNNNLSC